MAGDAGDGFGALLRRHRLAAGLTQEGLAARAGISARAVSDLERGGGRMPRLETVGLLATALVLTDPQRAALLAAARPDGGRPSQLAPQPEPPHLFGREHERALLRECLDAALAGRGRLALIGGEAGVGKTALAEWLCWQAAEQGALALVGRCYDLTETPPYGPWIDLFLHLPAARDLPPLPPAFAARGTVGAVASQIDLFAQVEDFLAAIGTSRPAVVLLDDLHWADPASLDLLGFLARSVATLPLLIVTTYRTDEVTRFHPLSPLLPQLARAATSERLDLARLDDGAVRALVDARYPLPDADSARLVAYLRSRAEGNVLFVGELLRALEEDGALAREGERWRLGDLAGASVPALLRRVIEARVSRLDEGTQRLLAVAAVIGQEVPLAVWAVAGECEEDALLAAAEHGLDAHLLAEAAVEEGVRFTHALIRETLYAGTPAIRRRRVHRRVGEALAAGRTPDPDAVASHFQRAGDDRALPWLLQAGERAQAAYSFVTAAARFEAALTLVGAHEDRATDRARLLFRVAFARRYEDPQQSLAYLEEAAFLAHEGDDQVLAARIQFYQGLILCYLNKLAPGVAALQAGTDALAALSTVGGAGQTNPDVGRATVSRETLILWLANAGHFAEAEAMGEQDSDGYLGLGIAQAYLGRPQAARRAFDRERDRYAGEGNFHIAGFALIRTLLDVVLQYHADDLADRERVVGDAAEAWTRGGGMVSALPARAAWLPVMVVDGRWDEARALGMAARSTITPINDGLLGPVAVAQGDRALVGSLIAEWLPAGPGTPPGSVRFGAATTMQRVAARQALDAGDLPVAKQWLDAHDRWLAWSGAVLGLSEGQTLWALYYRQVGDRERAYTHAERALAHALEPRQPLALLAAHRLLGELDTETGRFDDAARHLAESLALTDACAAPYERALTLLALAELRAATGEARAARTLLGEVCTICEPLGAKPALARANRLAARLSRAR